MMNKVIPPDWIIETARCLLRCSSVEDIPAMFEATKLPEFHQGMESDVPETIDELHELLKSNLFAWESGKLFSFTIADPVSNRLLGRIGIHRNTRLGVWNLGFWTHPEHQGKGYMTEAVIAIICFGFEKLDAAQIEASYVLWNKSSQRVMEKSGMKLAGYMPHGFQKRGQWVEVNKMRITRQEWVDINI